MDVSVVHQVPPLAWPRPRIRSSLPEDQIERAARALTLAFHDDPMQRYVFPDEDQRRSRSPLRFAGFLRFGRMFGESFTTAEESMGAVIAQPPGADVTFERAVAAGLDTFPTTLGREAFERLGKILDYLGAANRGDVPATHWYVMVVGVVPGQPGKGYGRALLEPPMASARAAELPCVLDTANPDNIPFSEHLGFRVAHDTVDQTSRLRFWTVVR